LEDKQAKLDQIRADMQNLPFTNYLPGIIGQTFGKCKKANNLENRQMRNEK
jgi:hypothetical protein